ncbi:flavin-containing monooxygenase [Brevibacterium yomogidense]|uniref:Putative flavin-containing monooxygenase n=1 Tax=Brevibacterium yomogidense TaxID=946573 RepID=A0A1X6XJ25_9MICO|nr:FAD-dependent oxidoreductase [Brevibacterium yomogidense]SLM99294.1 putative flavin-containing monooxygenase [Brevibacterium yomogidense]
MKRSPTVVVIGAGAAGLATAKSLLDDGIDVTVLEKGDRPGGLWAIDNASGLSPAYDSLHLNTSRRRTEFVDFPMPSDWPDYPSAASIEGYLRDYADTFGVTDVIRFGAEVTDLVRTGDAWRVTYRDLGDGADSDASADTDRGARTGRGAPAGADDSTDTLVADAVIVANGHNWCPRWPDPGPPGDFTGLQMHARDHRAAQRFAGERVLVVGMGNSAMDIAVDASYVAAAPVLLSARRGVHVVPKYLFGRPSDATGARLATLPWRMRQRIAQTMLRIAVGTPQSYGLPEPSGGLFQNHPTISDTIHHRLTHGEVVPRPGIVRFDGRTVHFADGSADEVDTLVWATGYRVSIPFLGSEWTGGDPERMPLYQRVFHLEDPSLMFVGLMQSTGAALPVVEQQAKLAAAHLAGRYALPARTEQQRAVARSRAAAIDRWGDSRPMMRIDFDEYVNALPKEVAAGMERARRGSSVYAVATRPTPTTPRTSAQTHAPLEAGTTPATRTLTEETAP